MSKNAHTPGPWNFYIPGGTAASNPNGAAFLIGPTRLYMDKSYGFIESDARLIAAAPDLLEALEAVISNLSGEYRKDDKTILMVEAAISKARGESC